ncbi:restriction endonuclease subunit S [Caldimonas thermodepolymerans]|uniref:restriction endonuclease subunit S n=1 Tax=Caldimonas thermodepolymerans TaxID=215580 RepID=UPI00248FA836|nr:restriction endonuclease subunit S [Caldimonas thermodepolymerans]
MPHEFVAAEEWDDKHILRSGDILFARSGATVGKTYLHTAGLDPAVFAGYCIRFRMGKDVLPSYVYGFTKTNAYASWVAAIQRPAGQPNINKEEFKSLEIPVPPIDVQRRLVAELDVARAERDRALAEAERLLGSIDQHVCRLLGLPDVPPPTQAAYAIRLGLAKQSATLSADYFHPERMTALRAIRQLSNAPLGQLVSFERQLVATPGSQRYIGLASVASHTGQLTDAVESAAGQCFAFEPQDVLYGRLRPYLNKVWLAAFAGVCSTEFHVMRVRDGSALLPAYLAVVMRTQLIVAQTKHMMTGNTHPRLANEDVVNLLIPLADMPTQQRIVDQATACQLEAARLRAHAETVWQQARERFEQQLLQGATA